MFWWNWWASVSLTLVTLLAVLVALFAPWITAHMFPPKLGLRLEKRTEFSEFGGHAYSLYHLLASAKTRWPTPSEADVVITSVSERGLMAVIR